MNVYLDNNATTRPTERVSSAVSDAMLAHYANPSSEHLLGREARARVERARESVAGMLNAKSPSEVIFTSCGTESIAQTFTIHGLKYKGAFQIVASAVEHTAVLEAAEHWEGQGARVDLVAVDNLGQLRIEQLAEKLASRKGPALVSMMLANNETGVIFPIKTISKLCREAGAHLHVDAVQAPGKLPIDVVELDCDYLSLSAHKFHGPKGTGVLYVRQGSPRAALIKGHQEEASRGGTENVPGIIGMGVAADEAMRDIESDSSRMAKLRDRLESGILSAVKGAEVNGDVSNRLCNTSNIHFPCRDASRLVEQLSIRGLHVSSGAACATSGKPSHVILAMGLGEQRANSSLRFSLSKQSTDEEIDDAISAVKEVNDATLNVYQTS